MPAAPLFLAAYTSSGLAGLIYEVAWTRLLTLYMGHTTAAASTVVAAFMGGLAAGSAIGGRFASRISRRQALIGYALLEGVVILTAILLPLELGGLMSLLKWAYRDGAPGMLFPAVRLVVSLIALFIPALAMGATFPLAVRWFAPDASRPGRSAGALYAANTAGAAIGAMGCGFVLIPALGASGANLMGVLASAVAIAGALMIAKAHREEPGTGVGGRSTEAIGKKAGGRGQKGGRKSQAKEVEREPRRWLAAVVLVITGFTSLVYEIAWTRTFASLIGPSTYAFASVLTGFVTGLAIGSAAGAWVAGRVRSSALPLACALGAAALAGAWTSAHAGGGFARDIVREFAQSSQPLGDLLSGHAVRVAALVAFPATALGFAFPFALDLAGRRDPLLASRLGRVYALNAAASVAGSITAGFVAIPLLGLQVTLQLAGVIVLAGALAVVIFGDMTTQSRIAGLVPVIAATIFLASAPPWDRELLASGGYKYAARVAKDLDLETALKAGTLMYYREGATGIVSVKRLTGDLSLAIDGKVDASTTGDMLTQKLLAHVPLLIHGRARSVGIIGLGSGVTLASALVHPIASADVVEISPEVVEASQLFAEQNRRALEDPRVRLVLGDGRTHLALSERQYDVIISEPSNPWMAGVAALFTREFFEAARSRLTADGILCQWAHTYDISGEDLRSVVATFASVFPDGTMWLVGDGDLLLIGSTGRLDERLTNVESGWRLPGVAEDLDRVWMKDPFALWSLYVGGPEELRSYSASAVLQIDDRMALEFSGPRAVNSGAGTDNATTIRRLLEGRALPPVIASSRSTAGARQWRDRGAMMLAADAYDVAYSDFAKAVGLDSTDVGAMAELVRAAVASRRDGEAVRLLKSLIDADPKDTRPRVALSKLQAATGAVEEAIRTAGEASRIESSDPAALDQLASLYADFGDAARLEPTVDLLQRRFGGRPQTLYFAAASSFLQGRLPAALGFIQQVVAADPKRADAYNMMGAIHASLGQVAQARAAFGEALRLNPRDGSAYTNLGLLELSAGGRAQARELFSESLSLDPQSAAARQGLADSR
jgi:spermidine synthase